MAMRRTKFEIQGRESVGESKCPEDRRNLSEEGEEEEVRGRGARKVAEEPGETLEVAGSRWESLEDAGRRRESLGSLERCWVHGKCCQKHQVVWADWVQLKERAQVVVVELIAQEEVGPDGCGASHPDRPPPLPPGELQQGSATLVCLASGGSPSQWKLSWKVGGGSSTTPASHSLEVLGSDGRFSWSSTLNLPADQWKKVDSVTCEASLSGQSSVTQTLDPHSCSV
ncbi:hypothetical protein D4764_0016510 [Takifugu flavidus]|uniref:Ig-like domain-containing protein n=1 Tax=Takifugu flavidus TaxID=433684 RepID=A0A5C6MIE9_9TELE|nr:hypothetical protein D4764_0016510 [Takifugu flavidus]